ncbi:Unconventional myosin-VIIb [Halotydeus destructor]|nr:Unconventional myosin-VIIb [Halotydeus destructor]
MGTAVGLSKVFILDKYFSELQKFWDTERNAPTLLPLILSHCLPAESPNQPQQSSQLQQSVQQRSAEQSNFAVEHNNNNTCPGDETAAACCNGGSVSTVEKSSLSVTGPPSTGPLAHQGHGVLNSAIMRSSSRQQQQQPQPVRPLVANSHDQKGASAASVAPVMLPSSKLAANSNLMAITKFEKSLTDCDDLIHLPGPLTENFITNALDARFRSKRFFTNVGPVLLSVNSLHHVGNALTLSSVQAEASRTPQLLRVVQDAVRQQSETGYPQAIIFRHLFDAAGGGPETDAFKHLAAAFTVLRSLGSAKVASNSDSSRIGHFIEIQITDGALYRTKIHSYFLDQSRVVKPSAREKNYHIFYQMLAGLTKEERVKLNLEGYSARNLRYLSCGDVTDRSAEDAVRFAAWKTALAVLGIPFMDVVRVLAAILLLGNVHFGGHDSSSGSGVKGLLGSNVDPELSTCGDVKSGNYNEVQAVASLLGISSACLYRGLTTRTRQVHGERVGSYPCDATSASATRDALARALYCRTVATIVRRANTMKRIGSTCGTLSSDSNESVHNHIETGSHHASTVGSSGAKSSKSLNVLNSAVRQVTDGFIGILDMFGFEDSAPSRLEQLCINLCAETMQHFYNTHIFKSSIESCKEEGIKSDIEVDYVDNVPCIDFISSLRTGLLSMLDAESLVRGNAESYVAKVKAQHQHNSKYKDVTASILNIMSTSANFSKQQMQQDPSHGGRLFAVRHFAGDVVYDTTNFLTANRDTIPDDIVAVFHKSSCTFGFATHLFGMQLKTMFSQDGSPRGASFRISPTAHNDLQANAQVPSSTLTQDFHTRLDNLLRTLVHARPHFVRCIKANDTESRNQLDRKTVIRQIRSLQVLETVNLMAGGFPHRVRFRAFNSRYRCLSPFERLKRSEDKVIDDCKTILECFLDTIKDSEQAKGSSASTAWAQGKRHIFLSEYARQQLERLRTQRRNEAATCVQSKWRGWHFRLTQWPAMRRTLVQKRQAARSAAAAALLSSMQQQAVTNSGSGKGGPASLVSGRPRPQPITGTPPPDVCDPKIIQQTCALFGLSTTNPPPVPPSRSYTVAGNGKSLHKLSYPQTRICSVSWPDPASGCQPRLLKGDAVQVIGASAKRGHLVVQAPDASGQLDVPYQYLELSALAGLVSRTTTNLAAQSATLRSTSSGRVVAGTTAGVNM